MQQVHGDKVVRVDAKDDGKIIPGCDALITNDSKVELVVRTADCLPISVRDKKSRAFGIIHAGWRGLAKEIIGKTIQGMIKEFTSDPENITIYIGPHICQKHYEVKEDVAGQFNKYGVGRYMDLGRIAALQLIESGVKKENIKIDEGCTFEDKTLFSYRHGDVGKNNIFSVSRHSLSLPMRRLSNKQIESLIEFQEKWFKHKIIRS